ncbi:MAG: hypothetical protein D6675_06415 [Gemmatimonadetes bacterium]|nr:MAG: hypothetical protein D6675_06415 [Gemmatimonadota bacterium]
MPTILRGIVSVIVFVGAVFYGISPVDLFPDPMYLDDVGILIGAVLVIWKMVTNKTEKPAEKSE